MIPLRDYNPTRRPSLLTWGLILINFGVYFYLAQNPVMGEAAIARYAVVPADISAGRHLGTLITSMFLHASLLHVGGNMLFLWIFGNNVEDALGKVRFLLWYLAAGLAATAAQTFVTLDFGSTRDASIPNIGASGAIAGVLGAYLLLLPRATVLTAITLGFFFIIREIPAIWFLGIWIALQLWQGGVGITHPDQTGGVAVFAHIGGFAFGLLTVYLVAKRRPLQPTY